MKKLFSPEALLKIRQLTSKADKYDKSKPTENVVALCKRNNGIITIGKEKIIEAKGIPGGVSRQRELIKINSKRCKKDEKYVGEFHTHPGENEEEMSCSDIEQTYMFGVGCIGTPVNNKLKCWVRKDKHQNPVSVRLFNECEEEGKYIKKYINSGNISFEENIEWKKLEEKRKKTVDELFDTYNIR